MKQNKIFFPNLDGLRFLSFLSVFLYHSFYTKYDYIVDNPIYIFVNRLFVNGNIGVNFFFVLSGFLITYLLIKEKEYNGKINIPHFWFRRILRIWPLYFFCVFFGFFIFPFLKTIWGEHPNESAHLISYLTFTSNFDLIKNGLPDSSVLGILWSIAIEEQFYFFWPVLMFMVKPRYYMHLFLGIIFMALVFRYFNNNYLMHEYHTLSCISDMSVGALGALLSMKKKVLHKIKNIKKYQIAFIYAVFISICFFRHELFFKYDLIRVFERLILSIFILLIILEQNFALNSFFKISQFKTISKLGTITYGLYCLHFIGILITLKLNAFLGFNTKVWQVLILETGVALLISILISKFSYAYFESFFLGIKNRFSHLLG